MQYGNIVFSDEICFIGLWYCKKTSEKLVDSVKLDGAVTSGAYTELTFDLTAALTSVQVDKAEDGTYKDTTAVTLKTGAEVDSNTGKPTWPAAASGTNEP